jgi:hypothetical protein
MDHNNKIINMSVINNLYNLYDIDNIQKIIYSSILYISLPQDIINIILSYTNNFNAEEIKKMTNICEINYKTRVSLINEINDSIYKRIEKERKIDEKAKEIKAFYLSSFTKKEIIYDVNYYNDSGYISSDTVWENENENENEWSE